MWLNPYGEDPLRLAVALANDPPRSLEALVRLLDEHDLELPRSPVQSDLDQVRALMAQWLTVVDAAEETERAFRLNELLAQHAGHPRLTDHRGTGWHLHFRDDDSDAGHLVAVIVTVATALHLTNRGMRRLGRCAVADCDRVWADFTRPGTQRYCSPRCANTDAVRRHRARTTDAGRTVQM